MKRTLLILGFAALMPTLAWLPLAPNKQLVDLECYEEKGKFYYRGVWMKGSGGQILKNYANTADFETDAADRHSKGQALKDIALRETPEGYQVMAVYDQAGSTGLLVRLNSWEEFETDWKAKQKEGMQVVDFDFYSYLGEDVYYGVYRKMDKKSETFTTATWTEMETSIEEHGKKKFELMDVDRAMINGSWHYVAFFNQGDKPLEYKAFKVTSNEQVERQASANALKGVILVETDGFIQGNANTHLTVYVKQPQPNQLFSSEDWAVFEAKFNETNTK